MDKNNEKCAICGEPFMEDDVKIYCPDCGAPMHKDCWELEGGCPNKARHFLNAVMNDDYDDSKKKIRHHFENGEGCEICGKLFTEDDEKVFCPDCGASMHKLCYDLTHRCPYFEDHSYPARLAAMRSARARQRAERLCDKCGKELDNGDEKVYCPVCGTPVHKECWDKDPVCPNESRHAEGYDWDKAHASDVETRKEKNQIEPPKVTFENFPELIIEHPICSPEDGQELTCFGVTQSELMHFLGMYNFSTPRFFTLFMNMANAGKVVSVNISAWFFAPLYHFYRRMTGPAVVLTLATFILMVPTLIYEVMLWKNGDPALLDSMFGSVSTIASSLLIIVRVALLLFNDYIYMRWSVSRILSLREEYRDASEDEYFSALEHYGNPRMMYVLGGLALLFLLVYLLNVYINMSGLVS